MAASWHVLKGMELIHLKMYQKCITCDLLLDNEDPKTEHIFAFLGKATLNEVTLNRKVSKFGFDRIQVTKTMCGMPHKKITVSGPQARTTGAIPPKILQGPLPRPHPSVKFHPFSF